SYHFYFEKPTNDLSSQQANFNGDEPFGMAAKGPFLERPTRVGAYPPNKLGLYDMHGNVWQMTSPQRGSVRRFRGGGWFTGGLYCRAGHRTNGAPLGRFNHLGFRLARVPRGQQTLDRTQPAALPFRQGIGPGGQKDRGPPGVSSTRERFAWPFLLSRPD